MTSDPNNATNSTTSTLTCPACSHSQASHDPIGTRFCVATTDRELDRNCICVGDKATV